MMLNPTVPLRNFFDTLQKIDPEGAYPPPSDPNPKAKVMEKKLGPEGVRKSKIGRSEAEKWSGDAQ